MPRGKKIDIPSDLKQFADEQEAKVLSDYQEYLAKKGKSKLTDVESNIKLVSLDDIEKTAFIDVHDNDARKVKKERKPRTKKEVVQMPSPIESMKDHEPELDPEPMARIRKPNKWIEFVKQYRIEHPDLTYTAAMTQAKVAYVR
jgi:hypothetical protein